MKNFLSALVVLILIYNNNSLSSVYKGTPADYINLLQQLQNGDTLLLSAGNYPNGLRINNLNGETDKWIVIKAEQEHTAVLVGRNGSNTSDITNSSYVKIEGLKFDGKNIADIDAIKASGSGSNWAHHIWIHNNIITGHGNNQQTVGISTKIPCWDWIISNNRVLEAGTGIYLGNSDGSMPFIRGIIEFNLILNPVGYCMQIKHQNERTNIPNIPTGNLLTIIRHNVFSKDNRPSPDGDRPCLLFGGQPLSGDGTDDRVEIYGNFFFNNPREYLIQGTGNISIHNNLLVSEKNGGINLQVHNSRKPKEVFVYQNSVLCGGTGIRWDAANTASMTAMGNAVYSPTQINPAVMGDNLTGILQNASGYYNTASFNIDSLDLFPSQASIQRKHDLTPFGKDIGSRIDFNEQPHSDIYYGAYSAKGQNPGWKPALDIKKVIKIPLKKTWLVGPSRTYKKPSEVVNLVSDGDTVEIDAALYSGDVAIWNKSNLTFRGLGGFAHLDAAGKNAQGKAIWVIQGNNTTVENIEFSGCTVPDKNGAGIRQEGSNLTIQHCYFHDNEDGILTGANPNSDIIIYNTEFARNGYGDGYSHNLYVGNVKSLTFCSNYSHHAKSGHNLKSRAQNNYIAYNRIMDEETGNSSFLIDLPNGGYSIIKGNLLMQGPNAENKKLINYGAEGLSNKDNSLYIGNNTMINKRQTGTFIYIQSGAKEAKVLNNIFAGVGEIISGTADTITNLYFAKPADAWLVDEVNYDYHLKLGSPAIDAGTYPDLVKTGMMPDSEYHHPLGANVRLIYNNKIDIGAYEFEQPKDVPESWMTGESYSIVYPNPATDKIKIKYSEPLKPGSKCQIHSLSGGEENYCWCWTVIYNMVELDIRTLPAGTYYFIIYDHNYKIRDKKIFVKL